MRCEESFITMKLHCDTVTYLVFSIGNCVHESCTEIGLRVCSDLGEIKISFSVFASMKDDLAQVSSAENEILSESFITGKDGKGGRTGVLSKYLKF
jgi:hypothetical protein